MSDDTQHAQMPFASLEEEIQERMEWRQRNINQLRANAMAHQQLPFPDVCKGRSIRKIDLEQATRDLHALVAAFLASDHRYNFFTAEEKERLKRYKLTFDIVLNRAPPKQRLKGADRDYFLVLLDIEAQLKRTQTKDRGLNRLRPNNALQPTPMAALSPASVEGFTGHCRG